MLIKISFILISLALFLIGMASYFAGMPLFFECKSVVCRIGTNFITLDIIISGIGLIFMLMGFSLLKLKK